MNGQEAIIAKLTKDSREQADKIVYDAEQKKAIIIEETTAWCNENMVKAKNELNINTQSIAKKKSALADSEIKKLKSSAKKTVIDRAFESAVSAIISLSDKEYLTIIEGMLMRYAEDGDVITISSVDSKRITSKFVSDVAKKLKINLSLSNTIGKFNGGIILSSKSMDKNLTLEVELKSLREEIEPELAKLIAD